MIVGVVSAAAKAIIFQPSNNTKADVGRNYQLKMKCLRSGMESMITQILNAQVFFCCFVELFP